MNLLLYGFITGIIFGFLLQKANVLRYEKQLGALRLQDFTIVKFMLSSVIVSMVGIYLLYDLGLVELDIKTAVLGSNVLGGLIFGIGWALVGYCPGTAVGALGEGRYDSAAALIGMLVGAALYAEVYPVMKKTVLTWGNLGKITLHDVLGISHWVAIVVIILLFVVLFSWFEKKRL